MNKFVVGIDPGKGGGIVTLSNGKIKTIDKMPQSPRYLWDFFIGLGFPNMIDSRQTWVFIENVHAMPNDAKGAIWSFAKHVGHLEMLSELLSMAPRQITPQTWQKWLQGASMGLKKEDSWSKEEWKRQLRDKAKEIVPKNWEKSITLATADALWIALYGWEVAKNEEENTIGGEKSNHRVPIR